MTKRLASFLACTVMVLGLAAPAVQMLTHFLPEVALWGYEPAVAPCPSDQVSAWFDGRLQRCLDGYVRTHIGFRGALLRTFNEITFRIFGEVRDLIFMDRGGVYGNLEISYLNNAIVDAANLREKYRRNARKARVVQELFKARDVYLINVIAASKVFVNPYPLSRRYLQSDPEKVFAKAANYGAALQEAGANVLDFDQILRERQPTSPYPFHGMLGLHWNWYTGCLVAGMLVDRIERDSGLGLRHLSCDPPHIEPAHGVDLDGLENSNIWSDERLRDPLPYPNLRITGAKQAVRPRALVIGDSFTEEFRRPLLEGGVFSYLDFSNYFATHQVIQAEPGIPPQPVTPFGDVKPSFAEIIKPYRVVILETVDYNIRRDGFGFLEKMLDDLLQPYVWGEQIVSHGTASGARFLIAGWDTPPDRPVETRGPRPVLAFKPPPPESGIRLTGRVRSRIATDQPRSLQVTFNGTALGFFTVGGADNPERRLDFDIPAELLSAERSAIVEFGATANGDDPDLAITDLAVGPAGAYADDEITDDLDSYHWQWNQRLNLSTAHPRARDYLGKGWSNPEPFGTWTDGTVAEILLPTPRPTTDVILSVNVAMVNGQQAFDVVVNDAKLATFAVDGHLPYEYRVRIPRTVAAARSPLAIALSIPRAFSPHTRGLGPDRRTLGLGIVSVSVRRAAPR